MAERQFTDSDGWAWTVRDVAGGAYVEMTAVPDDVTAGDGGRPVTSVIPRRDLERLISAMVDVGVESPAPSRPACDGTCGDCSDGPADDAGKAADVDLFANGPGSQVVS